jgi:hypothetical protein
VQQLPIEFAWTETLDGLPEVGILGVLSFQGQSPACLPKRPLDLDRATMSAEC